MNSIRSFHWLPVLALGVFAAASMVCASRKPLWLDELFGFETTRGQSWGSLATRGAAGQASPAPLFYVGVKAGQRFSIQGRRIGVSASIYTRWVALGPALAGAALLFTFQPAGLVYSFLASKALFVQSFEARPYALWLTLTVLFLALLGDTRRGLRWCVVCVALGLTATVSLFQMAAAGFCMLLAGRLFPSGGERPVATFLPMAIGVLLGVYYALYTGWWGYRGSDWATWPAFLTAFARQSATVIGAVVLARSAYMGRNKTEWVLYSTILSWFLMSPLLFALTRSRGFFFHERHYIFWAAAAVMVFWGIARKLFGAGWPGWRSFARPDQAFLGLLFLFCLDRVGPHHALWEFLKTLK